jgi:hypothetical protein
MTRAAATAPGQETNPRGNARTRAEVTLARSNQRGCEAEVKERLTH